MTNSKLLCHSPHFSQHLDWTNLHFVFSILLEGTAHYAGLLLAPAEGFGRGQGYFALWKKKRSLHTFLAYFRPFWCLFVTFVMFSSTLRTFEKNPKNPKKFKISKKKSNNLKSPKKTTTKKTKKNVKNKTKQKNPIFCGPKKISQYRLWLTYFLYSEV